MSTRHATVLRSRGFTALGAAGLAVVLLSGGCLSTKSERSVSLRAEQFADPNAPVEEVAPPSAPRPAPKADRRSVLEASEGVMDVVAKPGKPVMADPDTAAPKGASVLVDGTAGYINNKAIYINDFLAPMADRLRAEARTMPRAKWIAEARLAIFKRLELLVRDELLRAEAMASVANTDEKRKGLLAYFDQKRGDILRHFGGTESSANEQLAQREDQNLPDFGADIQGKSVDEVLDAIKKREMINYQLQTRVGTRAYVPFRDVRNAYENQYARFNPPPTVVYRIIRVPAAKKDVVEEATRQIAAGADFAELASQKWNDYLPDKGGQVTRTLEGAFETTTLLPVPALDEALHKLKPGGMAGPITYAGSVYWIKLEEVRTSSLGLYQAQLALERELRGQKFDEELARHIDYLKKRATFTGIEEMTERLTAVAIERYYPEPVVADADRK